MPRSTLTSKGQITLPKEIRDHLRLENGDRVNFEIRDGTVIVEPETVDMKSLRGVVKRRGKKKVSIEDMSAAVRRGASGR